MRWNEHIQKIKNQNIIVLLSIWKTESNGPMPSQIILRKSYSQPGALYTKLTYDSSVTTDTQDLKKLPPIHFFRKAVVIKQEVRRLTHNMTVKGNTTPSPNWNIPNRRHC